MIIYGAEIKVCSFVVYKLDMIMNFMVLEFCNTFLYCEKFYEME